MAASQKYMAYIVPLFALSGLYWQFGLVLYWVTTNLWTLGQQYVLFKRYPMPAVAGAPAVVQGKVVPPGKSSGSGKPAPGKAAPAGRASADGKSAPARKPARGGGKPAADTGSGQASGGGQGSANGSGVLRRLTKGRPEPEPQPAEPETKLVRQQRTRQSRSKRSGKR
jgi:YidC/Oxa1 family membrane protein insertase